MTDILTLPVEPKSVIWNPSPQDLRRFTEEMPNCRKTEFGNVNVATRVVSRSKLSTYIATDRPEEHSDQTITRAEYDRVAKLQNDYIRTRDMLVVDGFIGNDPQFRVPARLIIEKSNANIAGMQQILYYPASPQELENFEPKVTVIYTPNLKAEGYPEERLIAVDLENYITRVFNSDYFGESKKGGLRMWNKIIYERGGLAMHSGCKVIPVGNKTRAALIVGLSGTGKTTTTFTKQNNSSPVQDDFIALMPGGKICATENGCFAKTFGLNVNDEPTIYHACASPHAYLENVSQNDNGKIDYFDTSYTPNGRAVIRMSDIAGAYDAREIKKADFLLILNRNENIIPAVAKLEGAQAAAYFMLGETKGTSAGGAAEAGKSLRVPGTNPFFPLQHAMQGNRFLELLKGSPMEVYLMNTGRIGGGDKDDRGKKVKIQHSSAIVKAIAEGTIKWTKDPDFGYLVATDVPGIDDHDYLEPKKLYERQGRIDEYNELVRKYYTDRREYLRKWKGLSDEIVKAVYTRPRSRASRTFSPRAGRRTLQRPSPREARRGGRRPGEGPHQLNLRPSVALTIRIADCNLNIAISDMTLGEKVRFLRTVEGRLRGFDRELTQQELAKEMGISQSYLSQIERGTRPHLTNTTRMALARFFKVHPGYLVDDPEGFHTELTSDVRTLEDNLDLWLISGAEQFADDPEVAEGLLKLAKHPDTRRCMALISAILETPELVDRLLEVLA